jgi:two-component system sensor histidine kinase KdpD
LLQNSILSYQKVGFSIHPILHAAFSKGNIVFITMLTKQSTLPFLLQIALSISFVIILTCILIFFQTNLSTPVIALLFLFPVVLSSGYFNLIGGITSSFAAFLAFNYFFIPPFHTLAVHQTQDLLALIVFLVVAVMISQSLSQAKIGLATAVDRERETTILYELNVALSGSLVEEEILRTVGEKILEHFPIEIVHVFIKPPANPVKIYMFPPNAIKPSRQADISLNLSGGGDSRGGINIWSKEVLSQPQERLLRAFASQTTLVLEKAYLADAEGRARLLEESDKLKSTLPLKHQYPVLEVVKLSGIRKPEKSY